MKVYFIKGAKWWDKINGNTYCNAKVIDQNGETMFYIGYQYGYGSFYLHEAEKMLKERLRKNAKFKIVDLGAEYIKKRIVRNNEF